MRRQKRASQRRGEMTPPRSNAQRGREWEEQRQRHVERYAAAFARVRLARAWVAVVAAIVAMLSAQVPILERVARWLWSFAGPRPPHRPPPRVSYLLASRGLRLGAVLVASSLLGLFSLTGARSVHAFPAGGGGGMPGTVSLTHDGGGTASVYTNGAGSTTFTLQNISASTVSINLVVTTCSGSIAPGSCSPSPSGTTLGVGQSTTITVDFTGGASAGSGTITLAAKNASNVTQATASVAVTVATAPQGPIVSLAPHRGDMRDVSQCIADCFESTLAYTTPAYISLDVPRSVTLLYRSGRAKPMGRITFDVSDTNSVVTSFRLMLTDPNGTLQTFGNGSTSIYFARNTAAGSKTRLVADFDASAIPTSAKLYSAYVTSFAGSTPTISGSVAVRIIVLNDQASQLGAGVDVVGLQRLLTNQTGGVLVTDGTGSASFFSGSCSTSAFCTFTSPAGDFSTLKTLANGTYVRVYPDSTKQTFNGSGYLVSTADRFGATTTVTYATNSTGVTVPVTITDPTGQTIVLNYHNQASAGTTYLNGSLGQISIQQGARLANFGVMPSGNLEYLVDVEGYCCSVAAYDGQHRLTQFTNKLGVASNYAYRYGATVDSTLAPSVVIADGTTARPRVLLRNAADALLAGAAGGGGTTSASALAVPTDLRASITDPAGNVTRFSLNKFGSPTKTTAPLIPADSTEYDASTGQVARTISPTGHDVIYTYDSAHRLKTVNDVTLGKADTITYTTQYSLPDHISGTSGETWFTYWTAQTGWPLKTTSPINGGLFTTHYPDAYGRDTAVVDPVSHRTSFAYQTTGLRNHQSVRTPNGLVTSLARDASGRVTGVKDPYAMTQRTEYDVLNRPTWTADSASADTTKFIYNMVNVDTMIVDAKGQTYKFLPNALGWVTQQITPGSGTDSIFYDVAGRVARTRSRANRDVQFFYDSLSRLVKRVAGQNVDSLWYDPNGTWVAAQSRIGANVISTDVIATDEQNRIAKATTTRSSVGEWRVDRTFNAADPGISSVYLYRRVNNADITEAFTTYHYQDAQKRLTAMRSQSDTANFFYSNDNLVDSVTMRAGLTEAYGYTWTHELSTRSYAGASWVDNVLKRWYRTDSLQRIAERGGPDSLFQAFTYDSIGRLHSWQKKAERTGVTCISAPNEFGYTCTGATPWNLSLAVTPTYDKVGNPNDAGTVVGTGNRLTSFNGVTATYDADGFMTTRVTATTTDSLWWDDFGRLTTFKRVPQGGSAVTTTFAYDGFGRRIRKTAAADTVEYLWDGEQIVAELNGTGSVKKIYTYYPGIDQPRSVTSGGETYFFSTESDGTVNGVIRKSDRAVVAQYAYTPWGELETSAQAFDSVSNLRWKGLPYDSTTGLYSMRARYYDAKLRRFVSEDPIGLAGGINQYAFADADPVNRRDPSGLCWVWNAVSMANSPENVTPTWYWSNNCPSAPAVPGVGGIYDSPWGDPTGAFATISTAAVANTLSKVQRSSAPSQDQLNRAASELAWQQWSCHVNNVNRNLAAIDQFFGSLRGKVIHEVGSKLLGWLMPVSPKTTGLGEGAARLVGSRLTPRIAPPLSGGVAVGSGASTVGWMARAGGTSLATTAAFKVGLGLGATYDAWEGCQ